MIITNSHPVTNLIFIKSIVFYLLKTVNINHCKTKYVILLKYLFLFTFYFSQNCLMHPFIASLFLIIKDNFKPFFFP